MANPEHVEILKKGAKEWNAWIEENPRVEPVLIEAELLDAKLKGTKLKEANLFGEDLKEELIQVNLFKADLSGADLVKTNLSGADLFLANLKKANLRGANLRMANLSGADLSGANLRGADFSKANLFMAALNWAFLFRTKLHGANLRWADLTATDLMLTNLTEAKLNEAELFLANLNGADLRGADFSEAKLIWTDLKAAKLGQADLRETNLSFANFNMSNLNEADLKGANLSWANLSKAELSRADFYNSAIGMTIFADVDLSEAKGLNAVKHLAPSSIGIDTIYKSKGKIPEIFLRKAGVPRALIKSILGVISAQPAIQYYKCFISYDHRDKKFTEKLHADLEKNDVRCWKDTEDMRTGAEMLEEIHKTIGSYDKVLVVLSKNSINSAWVKDEVEIAFEEERKRGTTMLFPIRLDNAVLDTDKGWTAKIGRRYIGDFTKWEDDDEYKKAFDRLLHDLAEE